MTGADPDPALSDDQAAAMRLLSDAVGDAGADLEARTAAPPDDKPASRVVAVLGKAGSGKTHLLARLVERLSLAGAKLVTPETESRLRARGKKGPAPVLFAVVAPTNKAASVLRARGVAATTIHRIVYSPVYDPAFEALSEWLADPGGVERPSGVLEPGVLDRVQAVYQRTRSAPAALAAVGLRTSEFITGWKRREDRLSIGLVDEASMLDDAQLSDLRAIFDVVCLFGDPAQLAPIGQDGAMVFDGLPGRDKQALARVHRQAAGNPIIDLAYALQEDDVDFEAFEALLRRAAAEDERVVVRAQVDADLAARAPVLVWRNETRKRLIGAFRAAHGLPPEAIAPGEPLICDGLELPAKARDRRIEFEQLGLVKGAQAFWLGPGRTAAMAQIHLPGAPTPSLGVAAIIQIERPGDAEPLLVSSASMGAVFVHGAACTVHKAQGSQWPEVQVFAPDLMAAARFGKLEAGVPLWRRLAYVAITRAETRLHWIVRPMMGKPKRALGIEDLVAGPLV